MKDESEISGVRLSSSFTLLSFILSTMRAVTLQQPDAELAGRDRNAAQQRLGNAVCRNEKRKQSCRS
jgi:hypothetical protein